MLSATMSEFQKHLHAFPLAHDDADSWNAQSGVKLHHGPKEHVSWEGKSLLLHLIQAGIIMVVIIWGLVDCTSWLQVLLPK